MKTLLVRTLDQWRAWLTEHHASASEVWLIFHKRHTGVASIAYKDARDEALCFGWVDSLVKRLDDRRYAQKFTPRRADSRWSAVNRRRYAELKAAGRLKPAGIERPPTDRGYDPRPPRLPMPSKLRRTSRLRSGITRRPCATSKRWHPSNAGGISPGLSPPSARKRNSGV